METSGDNGDDAIAIIKEMRKQLESRIEAQHSSQTELFSSLQALVPEIVCSVDLSVKVISFFNNRPFTPTPATPPNPNNPNLRLNKSLNGPNKPSLKSQELKRPHDDSSRVSRTEEIKKSKNNESGNHLAIVRSMIAACLLQRVPFTAVDSSTVLRKLENDQNVTAAEKAALRELGGESGAAKAVEIALRSMAEDNAGVNLDEFVVSGKSSVMVWSIDQSRLMKELPENLQQKPPLPLSSDDGNQNQKASSSGPGDFNAGFYGMGGMIPRPMSNTWLGPGDSQMSGMPTMFPGTGPPGTMLGPRGTPPNAMGMMGMPRGMMGLQRPQMVNSPMYAPNTISQKMNTDEDELKDLEAMLNKKSFKEMQKSKTGEELLDLIQRPTAKETAMAAKFKTKGGSQVREYCSALTKEDCRRQSGSYIACEKVHYRRIIAPHTDVNLGDCSFLDTCRHMKTCKYVHYELDPIPDVSPMMMGAPPRLLKPQRPEYCSEVELGQSQWINCDIRNFRMDILGQYGVIMADPPWDIHMELPYGTMADDEMRTLNVPALQTDGLIFLWVTGRAMELGRECLELWGYTRVEEIIWVKTNQLQRIIRTGRTGHWLNHSKEHCLVGIKGNPEVNRNIDTDVIVAEVRETSRKPDEMYSLLERISPRTRKLELFARMHNTQAGWMSLGNQLGGVRLVDEGLRARFKAAYPEVEVQPLSPPRVSAIEADSNAPQIRSPFSDSKSIPIQFTDHVASEPLIYASDDKPITVVTEMTS